MIKHFIGASYFDYIIPLLYVLAVWVGVEYLIPKRRDLRIAFGAFLIGLPVFLAVLSNSLGAYYSTRYFNTCIELTRRALENGQTEDLAQCLTLFQEKHSHKFPVMTLAYDLRGDLLKVINKHDSQQSPVGKKESGPQKTK
jgi:hypothetical protein